MGMGVAIPHGTSQAKGTVKKTGIVFLQYPQGVDFGDEKAQQDTIKGLQSAEGFIRRELARTINMRNTPEIKFIVDQSIEYGVNISKKIDEVTKDLKDEAGDIDE